MARQSTDADKQDDPTSSPESVGAQPPVDFEVPTAPVMPDVAPSRQDEDEKSKSNEGRVSLSKPGAYEVTNESEAPVMPDVAPSRQGEDEKSKSKEGSLSLSKPGAYDVTKESEHTKLSLAPAVDPPQVERQENNAGPRNSATNPRMVQLAPAVHEESPRTSTKGAKVRTTPPATNPGAVQVKNNDDSAENAESEKNKLALAAGTDPAIEEMPGAFSETRDSLAGKIRLAPAVDTKTSTSEEKGTRVELIPETAPGAHDAEGDGIELKKEETEKSSKLNLAPAVPPPPTNQRPTSAMDSPRLRLAPAVDPGSTPSMNPTEPITSIDPAEDPASSNPSLDPSGSRQPEQQQQDGDAEGLLQAEVAPDVQQLVADAVRQAMTNTMQRNQSSRQNLVGEPSIALAEELPDEEQPQQVVDDEEDQSVKAGEKDESDEKEDMICGMPKRFVLVALVACIVAIIIAVASASGGAEATVPSTASSFSSESPSLAPSSMPSLLPSSSPTSMQLLSYGEALLPGIDVYAMDQESAEFRALEWIALEDGLSLDLASNELEERFRLAIFYLSTNGENWVRKKNWMKNTTHHCQWEFVACILGNVAIMQMQTNNLVGTLPTELFGLTNLVTLQLMENEGLRGTIPTEVGKLSALKALTFTKNEFTGTIPREIGQLSKVYLLSLSENEITGAIPTELALVTGLKVLDLSMNSFLSPIPIELTQLTKLIFLDLGFGMLQGSIPTEIGLLTNLAALFMFGNSLEGPIPSEIGNLSVLHTLDLPDNILTGPIPTEIGKLTTLTNLKLRRNFLSGTIPSEIGNLSLLALLDMEETGLVGAIPSEIGRLTGLKQLSLAGNELGGMVPSELNQLTKAHTVDLNGNGLTGGLETTFCNHPTIMNSFAADCLSGLVCGCCTHCCDSENGECAQLDSDGR